IQIEKAGLALRSPAIVGSATLAIAPSITDMAIPSAMVRMDQRRCPEGRPSACSTGVNDIVRSVLGVVFALRSRKLRDQAQPGRAGRVPSCVGGPMRTRDTMGYRGDRSAALARRHQREVALPNR